MFSTLSHIHFSLFLQEKHTFSKEICIGCTIITGSGQNVAILGERQPFGWDVRYNCVNRTNVVGQEFRFTIYFVFFYFNWFSSHLLDFIEKFRVVNFFSVNERFK